MPYNIPLKTWLDPRIEIRSSTVDGSGSFAKELIKKNEVVIIWGGGVVVTEKEFQKGFAEGKYQSETAIHFDETHKWVQLATDIDEQDAALNHSCDPNLWFVGGWPLAARRDIMSGEELTFDYSTGETYPLRSECRCDAINCRKKITGEEWKDSDFREKYKGHFNPYIQALIDKRFGKISDY